jgi:bifunctional non-homologous end joining protein LigD
MPKRLRPMLARPGLLPTRERDWAFEVKWDGVRAIVYWHAGRLRLESRNLNDVSARYPELHALGKQLGARQAVLDGEIVAFDERGAPSFERLQRRMHVSTEGSARRLAREQPVTYVIFDLLHLDGEDTKALPYSQRRELLEQLHLQGIAWQTPHYHHGEGRVFLAAVARLGLEGVLAKRLDSPYRPGERSGDWLKIKNFNRQELVIGGWLPGKGRRTGQLGALLLGYHEQPAHASSPGQRDGTPRRATQSGEKSQLRFAGRVGTGFDELELSRLVHELKARPRQRSPFSGIGVQPPKESHFVVPELVAEVEFSSWTEQGVLRHPIYRGLREDKPAHEVQRELLGVRADMDADTGACAGAGAVPTQPAPNREVREPSPEEHVSYRVLHETRKHADVEVESRKLRLSNRSKVLYPSTGFTKGDLIDYYAAVAPVVLPHLRGRALTLKRYPDGVEHEHFYEKHCPSHRPEWVRTVPIWSERIKQEVRYCVVEDLPTLVWTSNLADIELHTSLALASCSKHPTMLVFDLDPGAPAGLKECCRVALRIRELLDAFELRTLIKTSGSKGLQVYLPLNTRVGYEHTKSFARAVAELLEKQHPKEVVSRMAKPLRRGKVLIDWSQNDEHKTTVCAYSLRATERPLASTPLDWGEVERGARKRSAFQLSVGPAELLARVERQGDLFAPLLTLVQELPTLT